MSESTTTPADQQQVPVNIDAIVNDLSTQIAEQARLIAILRTTAAQNAQAAQQAAAERDEARAELKELQASNRRSGSPAKKAAAKKAAAPRRPKS